MKRLWKLSILCFVLLMLSACGWEGGAEDDGIQIVESEPLNAVNSGDVEVSGVEEPDREPEEEAGANIESNALESLTGEYEYSSDGGTEEQAGIE